MRTDPFLIASLALALTLAACVTTDMPIEPVMVAPGIAFVLPRPGDLGRSIDVAQLIVGRYGDNAFVFEGRLSANAERVILVGTDTMGRRAMTIEWRDNFLAVERAPWVPAAVRPENILADIVLMYWPAPVVSLGLRGADVTLTERTGGRSVFAEGRELISITGLEGLWPDTVGLRNHGWHYDIEVRSQVTSP